MDSLPIFGREPRAGPFTLFTFEVAMRMPSDVKNWHSRNGAPEAVTAQVRRFIPKTRSLVGIAA